MDEIQSVAFQVKGRCGTILFCGTVYYALMLKMVLIFESADEILKCDHSNKSYNILQCFPDTLFIMLYKVVLTFESVDEILRRDYSNESY